MPGFSMASACDCEGVNTMRGRASKGQEKEHGSKVKGMDGSASPRLREQQKGCENASLMKKVHDVPASHQLREE